MDLPVIGPTNRFLIPQRDRHWPQVLSALIGVAATVVLALALVGWPRLKSTSLISVRLRQRSCLSPTPTLTWFCYMKS